MSNVVLESIMSRRSVRKYSDKELTDKEIKALSNAALTAPSALNRQPWHISVINNKELINCIEKDIINYYVDNGPKQVIETNARRENKIFYNAPTVFIISRINQDYSGIDAGIVAQSLTIAAKSMELDSVILGLPRVAFPPFSDDLWAKKFGIPKEYVYAVAVAVGHGEEPEAERELDRSKITYVR